MNYRILIVLSFLAISFSLVGKSALAAQENSGATPGWGHGDTNHVHVGPPGQSDRPNNVYISVEETSDVVQKSEYHSFHSKVLKYSGVGNVQIVLSNFFSNLGF